MAGRESAVGGYCRGVGVNRGFRSDEVVGGERDGGLGGREHETKLRADVVAGQGRTHDTFAENKAVVDGGYGGCGSAYVDD